ncbi:hypothetical protein [Halovivax sp.]|uniref:DUF7504 family protein n=1 Tax=Halovivax sp. TaxID=1935978 RepID=UPI0025C3743F|nr:hypothetical protein [Halovivax sp.]
MRSEPGVGVPESASFAQALGTLKRRGSNILVVGAAGCGSHGSACNRLLGDGSNEARFRLVVATDPGRVASHAERGEDGETRFIVQRDGDAARSDRTYPTGSVIETEMLGVTGAKFVGTLDEFDEESDLAPSELRVCVDSVSDLVQSHDAENVFRLLHVMTTRIRRSRGMGHFHFPIDREEEAARLFEPLFDAVVELRSGSEGPEHRWHLRDRDADTDWISL